MELASKFGYNFYSIQVSSSIILVDLAFPREGQQLSPQENCSLEHGRFFFGPFAKLKASAGLKGLQSCSHVRTRSLCLPAKGSQDLEWLGWIPWGAMVKPTPVGWMNVAAIHRRPVFCDSTLGLITVRGGGVMRKLTVKMRAEPTWWWFWSIFWKFYPGCLGRWSHLTTNVFHMGWFNHNRNWKLQPYKPYETPLPCQQFARHSRSLKEVLAHTLSSLLSFHLPTLRNVRNVYQHLPKGVV